MVSWCCRALNCHARGHRFKPQTGPTPRVLKYMKRRCCLCYNIYQWLGILVFSDKHLLLTGLKVLKNPSTSPTGGEHSYHTVSFGEPGCTPCSFNLPLDGIRASAVTNFSAFFTEYPPPEIFVNSQVGKVNIVYSPF